MSSVLIESLFFSGTLVLTILFLILLGIVFNSFFENKKNRKMLGILFVLISFVFLYVILNSSAQFGYAIFWDMATLQNFLMYFAGISGGLLIFAFIWFRDRFDKTMLFWGILFGSLGVILEVIEKAVGYFNASFSFLFVIPAVLLLTLLFVKFLIENEK